MKKLSLVILGAVLFGGLSFASPVVKQDKVQTKTEKKEVKAAKPEKKAAKVETKSTKKEVKTSKTVKKAAK